MPGTNLTRDEARDRSDLVTVSTYHIDLDFADRPDRAETFRSETVIRFRAARPGASTFLDLVAPFPREVTLNGRRLDPEQVCVDGRVHLDNLDTENTVRVLADCAYANTGQGLHRTVDPADGKVYLYTHFEPADARRVYANFEQPDIKASFAFTVHAPRGWEAFSNSPTPMPEEARPGVWTWRFPLTPRQSTYITAVCAGEYHVERDAHTTPDGQVIPLAVAARASAAGYLDAEETFANIKSGFDYFIRRFQRAYPFAKYDQVFVPEYNIGAMENVGCVTVNESYLFRSRATDADHQRRNETLLHELAHMWFGDLVTMRWWDGTWLKESFATYMAALCTAEATRWTRAWTTFANTGKARALRQDELPSTHPIEADISDLDDVAANFDGITYSKGASVLKQLVAWVGQDAFFAGVKHYFDQHEYANTTLDDLLAALEKTSGRDLSGWSREWLRTSGPNTLRPLIESANGKITSFAVRQEATEEHPTLRSHRIAIGFYAARDGKLVRTHRHELDVTGAGVDAPELIGLDRPDIVLLNDDDLTYAKARFDDESLAALRRHGPSAFADTLPRALAWNTLWDMTRNAEMGARDYVTLALAGAAAEPDIDILDSLHANVLTAVDRYVAAAAQDATRAGIAATARRRLFAAEPGSDAQLAWARLLLRTASSDDDLAMIAALRDGARAIDGLVIDTGLRWGLTTALARCGWAGPAEISADLAADHTTAGAERAMAVLATRPTAEAKAEAWAQVMDTAESTNGVIQAVLGARRDATGASFLQATQPELLEPYVDKYFDALAGLWENRPPEMADLISTGLYPSLLVSAEMVERTDAYLSSQSPSAALRRILLEGRDDVRRALRARERDASADQAVTP